MINTKIPSRQIRAVYDEQSIRVYQAYSKEIAVPALQAQRFVPPFKLTRMTWIKPSFLWMMYRAGYGFKDEGQAYILAIDIKREGFEWALEHSRGSKPPEGMDLAQWQRYKEQTPVRVQWDPERGLQHEALEHRSIQIGLSGEAAERYVNDWIVRITDVTPLAHQIHALVQQEKLDEAKTLLPQERCYPLFSSLLQKIGGDE